MCWKKYIFFVYFILCTLNCAKAEQNNRILDNFDFSFKAYFKSDLKDNKGNSTNFEFKKSKLGIAYKINDKFDFVSTFVYSKINNFKFDCEYLNYHINNHSIVYFGNITTISSMYFEKNENHLAIIIPVINKATGFFVKSKGLGFTYKNNINNNFSFHIGIVGKNINDSKDDSAMATIRGFYFNEENNNLIHIGLNNSFIYNNKNKVNIKNIGNVYTNFTIKNLHTFGIELATRLKNYTFETETFYMKLNPLVDNLKNKYFDLYGFYIETTYFITGEIKTYDKLNGALKKIRVNKPINNGGFGAIELVARYQFNDAIASKEKYSVDMGRHNIILLGINWLPNNFSKILFNYMNISSEYKIKNSNNYNVFKIEYRLFF